MCGKLVELAGESRTCPVTQQQCNPGLKQQCNPGGAQHPPQHCAATLVNKATISV